MAEVVVGCDWLAQRIGFSGKLSSIQFPLDREPLLHHCGQGLSMSLFWPMKTHKLTIIIMIINNKITIIMSHWQQVEGEPKMYF